MNPIARFVSLLLLLAAGAERVFAQAAVASFTYRTAYSVSPTRAYVAVLDLAPGLLDTRVTAQDGSCASPATVSLEPTRRFAHAQRTFLAVASNTGPAVPAHQRCGLPDGLLVSDGEWANWPQSHGPVLYFPSPREAVVTDGALPWLSAIDAAVAGSTSQDSDCPAGQIGTLLVKDGRPGVCPIPKARAVTARTAIGVDPSGRYLIVLVATRSGSTGLRTGDLALLMMAFGATRAVNLDGGGSTTFYWLPQYGVPAECAACVDRITAAALTAGSANPNDLSFSLPEVLDPSVPVEYSASYPPRPVYASIGFRLSSQVPSGPDEQVRERH